MKVRNLIAQLSKVEQDADILVVVSDEHPDSRRLPNIYGISYLQRSDGETIFIQAFKDKEGE